MQVSTTKEYQELGIELEIKPNKLAIKSRLFDSHAFTKKLEKIYLNL